MLAHAVRRGDLNFPRLFEDNFNRPNSADLGKTPVGNAAWEKLRGSWETRSNRLWVTTNAVNPLVVIDAHEAENLDLQVGVSSSSGDALAFRVSDANNYLRLAHYYQRTSSTAYCTETKYICITAPIDTGTGNHTHDRACWSQFGNCCDRNNLHGHRDKNGVWKTHGDELAVPGGTRQVVCGTTSSTTRRLYLDRVQNGVVTTLDWWSVASPFQLGVNLRGNTITVRRGGDAGQVVGSFSTSFNASSTKHGVARRAGGQQGTSIDNFRINTDANTLV